MKIYCQECGAVLKTEKCKKCGADNRIYYRVEKYSKPSPCWPVIVLPIIFFVAVLASCVSRVVYPEAWSAEAYEDKQAAIEYVKTTYPEAEFIKGIYETMEFRPGASKPYNQFIFEDNGMRFVVYVGEGKITLDTYYEAKAEKYIREKYIDGFMNERGLTPDIKITFVSPLNHYGMLGKDVLDDVYNFKGSIRITIKQPHIVGISTPRDVGWFYDFYQYWTENCDLNNCVVNIYYFPNNDYSTDEPSYKIEFVKDEKTFSSEKDFYNAFLQ